MDSGFRRNDIYIQCIVATPSFRRKPESRNIPELIEKIHHSSMEHSGVLLLRLEDATGTEKLQVGRVSVKKMILKQMNDPKRLGVIGDAAVCPLLDIWNGPTRNN